MPFQKPSSYLAWVNYPIYRARSLANPKPMRKTGNGHGVDLERFLEDIKEVVRDGQELLRAGMGTLQERARSGAQSTVRLAKENPYKTVGIAFGLGVLAGLLLGGAFSGESEEEVVEEGD
jgi:ElaB/YqjD/DUF883 family membrane-anchored ribosome-binding protein